MIFTQRQTTLLFKALFEAYIRMSLYKFIHSKYYIEAGYIHRIVCTYLLLLNPKYTVHASYIIRAKEKIKLTMKGFIGTTYLCRDLGQYNILCHWHKKLPVYLLQRSRFNIALYGIDYLNYLEKLGYRKLSNAYKIKHIFSSRYFGTVYI